MENMSPTILPLPATSISPLLDHCHSVISPRFKETKEKQLSFDPTSPVSYYPMSQIFFISKTLWVFTYFLQFFSSPSLLNTLQPSCCHAIRMNPFLSRLPVISMLLNSITDCQSSFYLLFDKLHLIGWFVSGSLLSNTLFSLGFITSFSLGFPSTSWFHFPLLLDFLKSGVLWICFWLSYLLNPYSFFWWSHSFSWL